jgi:hypothetical protein
MRAIGTRAGAGLAVRRISAAVVIAVLAAAAALIAVYSTSEPLTHVPRVTGVTKSVALQRIARSHLSARVVASARARRLPPRLAGRIVHQNWKDGVTLPEDAVVRLTLYPRRGGPASGDR